MKENVNIYVPKFIQKMWKVKTEGILNFKKSSVNLISGLKKAS